MLARIIEPASKADSLRVLAEAGVAAASYPTLNRRLPVYATEAWRQQLSQACAAHAALGPASLVLYDVSTLYFETDQGDGFREPGFSKERRLEPQITIGLLADASGFPLMVSAFETSDAVKLSSCLGNFLCSGGECGGLVVMLAGDQAVVQAAEQAAEQVALGGGVPVTGVFAAVVVGAGAG